MIERCSAALLTVALLCGTVRAEVYEWRDGDGSRHFTNSLQGVPTQYQNDATVFVADWAHPSTPGDASASEPAPPPPPAVATADAAAWTEAYAVGLRDGAALGGGGGGGGSVQINGPLAIATTRDTQQAYPAAAYPPYGFYPPWPWYFPLVTTGFDRGRSRGLTVRMLLEDQFQIDRDGPYAYQNLSQPGLGPALAPFLPRGLPYGVSQFGRVIYR